MVGVANWKAVEGECGEMSWSGCSKRKGKVSLSEEGAQLLN